MGMTLLQSAEHSTDKLQKGVMTLITEATPILQYLTFDTIQGNAYKYDVEQSLAGIAFRAVGESYPRSTHVINSLVERLTIMGGEVFIDRFQLKTQGDKVDIKTRAWESKSRTIGLVFSEYFFEGDSTANFRVFDGLRTRLTGNAVLSAGTNGAALTLSLLDQFIDKIIGNGEGCHIFLNKTLRRKITDLGRNVANSYSMIDTGTDNFGKQVKRYNGVPLHVIERDDNEDTFLGFDETQGSSNVAASMYAVRFGDRYVHGIQGGGGSMDVYDLGESQANEIGDIGRVEWYPGLCIKHPRAAVRLQGVLNS